MKRTYGIKINKAGWIYIVLTVLIGLSAVNTGNNLIYIIASAFLSYMLVSGIFGRKNLHGITVTLQPPKEVYAGTEVPVAVVLSNNKRFMPAFLINLYVNGKETLFPFVPARCESKQYVSIFFEKRGLCSIEGLRISSVFPFNFFWRYRRISVPFQTLVFPRPLACDWKDLPDRQPWSKGDSPSDVSGFDADITAIRDYVSGDPLKYISWKSTAKTGVLKTKELSSIHTRRIMIDFNKMSIRDVERRLSCITFLILKLTRLNIPVGLSIDGEVYKPSVSEFHRSRMLKKLALYD